MQILPEYDFIVVGGGSAGAVVASRLSDIANWTVLLLEAGGDENEISDIPSLAGYTQMSQMDWMYQTSPPGESPYCLAMIGDRCNWPRGKVTQLLLRQCEDSVERYISYNRSESNQCLF